MSPSISVLRSLDALFTAVVGPRPRICHVLSPPKLPLILSFPDELLWEVFSHCLKPHMSTFSQDNQLWGMMRVCTRWRNVIVNSPYFWRHVSFSDWADSEAATSGFSKAKAWKRTNEQIMRSGLVPLTLKLIPLLVWNEAEEVLDMLLDASDRIEFAVLSLDKRLLRRLHKHAKGFPTLWKLGLAITEELAEEENEALAEFLDGLSALTYLHLSNQVEIDWVAILVPLESLWSRLRVCELTECMVDDVLLILPHFSAGSRLSLIQGRYIRGAPDTLQAVKHTELMGLSFDRCDDIYITRILDNLTAPALQRLAVWYFELPPFDTISAMLNRSSARLTHFGVRLPSVGLFKQRDLAPFSLQQLVAFFASEHFHTLIELDLILASRFAPTTMQLIHALSLPPSQTASELGLEDSLLPKLRALALRGYDDEDPHWEIRLMALAQTREGVLKEIWMGETLPAPSTRTRGVMEKCGVEFVCSWDMGVW
uniref:F-box domain-containing protein n=1 Tax=Mycena chlorophos TaxID=658473 RepID=A0ABQ0LWT5_MYCCL|nr:predicted protein [Mycena chlorophos]